MKIKLYLKIRAMRSKAIHKGIKRPDILFGNELIILLSEILVDCGAEDYYHRSRL